MTSRHLLRRLSDPEDQLTQRMEKEFGVDTGHSTALAAVWGRRAAQYLTKSWRSVTDDISAYECTIMAAHLSGLTGPEVHRGE